MDIQQLLKSSETPLYVYKEEDIYKNYKLIHDSIPYVNKQIHYAVMCNNRKEILKIFHQLGCAVHINSLHELELVKNAGFKSSQISFTSTGLDSDSILILSGQNIQINLDSLEELEKLGKLKPYYKVGIRVKMKDDIVLPEGHTNSPKDSDIGINISDIETVKTITNKYNLKINGVHGYLASNILDSKPFLEAADFLKDAAKLFPDLEYINFGGGFGIPDNSDINDFDFGRVCEYYSNVTHELSKFNGRSIQVKIEPGRVLMASCGNIYTRVTNIKHIEGKKQVVINAGFAEFIRPQIYNTCCEIEVENNSCEKEIYDIRANTVLQSDFLARNILLPRIHEGDILTIKNAGAYGAVMATGFPGKRLPTEVLITRNGNVHKLN